MVFILTLCQDNYTVGDMRKNAAATAAGWYPNHANWAAKTLFNFRDETNHGNFGPPFLLGQDNQQLEIQWSTHKDSVFVLTIMTNTYAHCTHRDSVISAEPGTLIMRGM